MTRHLFVFAASLLAMWLGVSFPAFLVAGWTGVVGSAAAAMVCGVPGLATLLLHSWTQQRDDNWRIAGILGGTFLRLSMVMGAGAALHATVPGFDLPGFLIWLMLFYLGSLALEVLLLVRGESKACQNKGT